MKSGIVALLILSGIPINSFSQESYLSITGKVLEMKTMEPLAYASIGIAGKSIGTVSNSIGEFEFFIPADLQRDSLFISYLGYKTFKERISNLKNSDSIFYLEEFPTLLNEVLVVNTELNAKEIVERALKAIPFVFPSNPYVMTAFHRSWEKMDFTDSITYPGTLIESAVSIYDPGYGIKKGANKTREEIYIHEIRRSNLKEGWNYKNGNWLTKLLRENLVKYNRAHLWIVVKSFLDFPNDLVYELEGTTKIDDEDLYIVTVNVPNSREVPANYKVYVSQNDFAILRIQLNGGKPEDDFTREWNLKNIEHLYIFKRYLGKPYLSYAKIQYKIKKMDMVKKKALRSEDYFMELLINDVVTTGIAEKRKTLSHEAQRNSLALQDRTYNAAFWKNYNIIKENSLDKEIISWFEKDETLEEQFRNRKRNAKQ